MRQRRAAPGRHVPDDSLCRGPGNLSQAMGISLAENRLDLTTSRLRIEDRGIRIGAVVWGPRIGIRVGVDKPWRCWVEGHPGVSGSRRPRLSVVASAS